MNVHDLKDRIGQASGARAASIGLGFVKDERQRLLDEITVLKTQILTLEHAADTDPLVPIYNRRAFVREIERAQTVMARYDILSSLIFFDLNGFKLINDQYGHIVGDELLTKIGMILKASVRDCDMVARLGGDEFGVLLFKTDETVAKAKASSLSCRISEQIVEVGTKNVTLNSAWGVSACNPQDTSKQILDRADRAMYKTKPDT
ncbi:MAG: GGDEF domain-containing protein [Robiginitomaculum sp.]|nr:MAG: GGDEF domain-containing protein [Robiginitomaculum sp.]